MSTPAAPPGHTCDPFHATDAKIAACPACQAGDTYEGWRAQAEALAGALRAVGSYFGQWDGSEPQCAEQEHSRRIALALARLPAQALAERQTLERSCAAWQETAAQNQRNTDYYRGLVEQIGVGLGESAYLADDGTRSEDVLCAKVPELVAQVLTERRALEACRDALQRIRAHWPHALPIDAPGDRTHPRVLTVQELRAVDATLDAARG